MASVVTGAFGFIGRHIAGLLIRLGESVRTVTTHVDKPDPFGGAVEAAPYNFGRPGELTAFLRGSETLYNTYWVRFEYGDESFARAVQNTSVLFDCAKKAGVRKIVHISVTHASVGSQLLYYRGKGLQERALIRSGVPYSIVRPALVFGPEDILVNNIAWLIRRFPIFPIFGGGEYRVQPVFVDDLAALAVASAEEEQSRVLDAVGPEVFTFREFVSLIASELRPSVKLVQVPPRAGIVLGRIIGFGLRDILLTSPELEGLMAGLLTSSGPPNGPTRFTEWLKSNKPVLGAAYSSELARHFRWRAVQGKG